MPRGPILQPAQIVRHVAEFPEQLGIAEFAEHGITGAAEGDRANAAGGPRQHEAAMPAGASGHSGGSGGAGALLLLPALGLRKR